MTPECPVVDVSMLEVLGFLIMGGVGLAFVFGIPALAIAAIMKWLD